MKILLINHCIHWNEAIGTNFQVSLNNPAWKSNWEHFFKVAVFSDICNIGKIAHSFCWTCLVTAVIPKGTEKTTNDSRLDLSVELSDLLRGDLWWSNVFISGKFENSLYQGIYLGHWKDKWIQEAYDEELKYN